MTTSNTNNQFKNDLASNLMVVSGETTSTTYTASNFSDKIDDVIKIVFNDNWRGNFRTGYDPINRTDGHLGFREDIFSANYEISKNFRVKQIDGATGNVIAEGTALRWVPGSKETGGGTLFIKELFHESGAPSNFNVNNGVIFCNEISPFTSSTIVYPANPMWAGSAVSSIQTASNVYKLTTEQSYNAGTELVCSSTATGEGTQIGAGEFLYGQRVVLKANKSDICNSNIINKGVVLASTIDTVSQKLSIFVQFDSALNETGTNPPGDCPLNCKTFLCIGDSANSCQGACCLYEIQTTKKISTPECGTVQRIAFADEGGSNFIAGQEVYQWKWEAAGKHSGNGTTGRGSDTDYKITGTFLNWDSQTKVLIVLAPSKLFEIKYGNIYQKDQNNVLISRGSAISIDKSNFIRKNGSFINIKNTESASTYKTSSEFYQSWPVTETGTSNGEYLVQTTETNETSYNPDYEYTVGETVIQALTESANGTVISQYAAGKVVSWEPNLTALSTIPSRLVIKRYEFGTDDPKLFDTNNTLVPKTKRLARFRIGTIATEGGDGSTALSILNISQRNILPIRQFNNIVSGMQVFPWYNFSSGAVIQESTAANQTDPELTGIGTIVKGSSIGNTRIKAIQEDSANYKIHLMDSDMKYDAISFSNVSQIGISGTETVDTINYTKIFPVLNVAQTIVNGMPITTLYEPFTDKMILPLPGGLVMENVTGGVSNFGGTELTIQKIYNIDFSVGGTSIDTLEVPIGDTISSAEFASSFSSSYSFGADSGGHPIKLIKYTGLQGDGDAKPADHRSVYYDLLQDSATSPRNRIIVRRKTPDGEGGITKMILGAEVKCVASSVTKTKTKEQFTETILLKYQTTGEFKGKWVAETSKYDVDSLISVFFLGVGGVLPLSANHKNAFGISNQTDDYSYNKSLLVLGADGLQENKNTDPLQGPIVPFVPISAVYTQTGLNATDFSVYISVTGIANSINTGTAGIIVRESYRDITGAQSSVKDMPFYSSKVDGSNYHSSAIIDTRPLMTDNNDAGNTKFVILPQSSTINTTLGIYLPRKDVLYINKDGAFKIVYGESSISPTYPTLPEGGLVLYKIDKPSYIFTNKDLTLNYTDNKRYTMRDIGRIEKRVQQLEVYSALSLLEKNADSLLVEDAEGNNRFKNGIIVDSFESHKIGDVSQPDYYISIDKQENCARPKFDNVPIPLIPLPAETTFIELFNDKTGVTGTTKNGDVSTGLYMMPFTSIPFVVQPQATRSITVTPFEVVQSEGIIRLSPREDDWVDTNTTPELNVNLAGSNDAWQGIVEQLNSSTEGPFALDYGNWSTFSRQTSQTRERGSKNNGVFNPSNNNRGRFIRTTTVSTTQQSREIVGEQVSTSTDRVSLGDRIVDVSIIPYMRAKRIKVFVTGMKSNSRLYPFFDGIDVSGQCYSYDSIAEVDAAIASATLDSAKKFSAATIRKTNAQGSAFIIFDMPAATFRTGDRKFTVSDSSSNDFTRASTIAGATFSAYGVSQVRQGTSATVRTFDVESVNRTEERVQTQTTVTTKKRDPLAQTFEINRELYPDGIFLSSIDIFFARKPANDTNIPVTVEVRPTVNGFPDINKIYSGGICILHPSQVNTSDFPASNNVASITKFTFEHPVYLEPGEHSFVVKSTSDEYEIYIAEIGQTLLNSTQRVTEQPYVGVFFTSSNASTWLPQPAMDMMMTMNKCEFTTNTPYTFTVETASLGKTVQYELLNLNNAYQEFENAKISWTTGTSVNFIDDTINANDDIKYTSTQTLLDSGKLYFTATGITTNKDISPVINTERLTLFAVKNLIENSNNIELNGELNPYASETTNIRRARYITKIVTLEDGFESNGFKLILSVNKPTGSKIQAFLKTQTVEQTRNFHENPYVQMVPKMGATAFDAYSTQYEDEFVDVEFDLPPTSSAEFIRFAIKICLYSENAAYVPRVKDMRGIAVL